MRPRETAELLRAGAHADVKVRTEQSCANLQLPFPQGTGQVNAAKLLRAGADVQLEGDRNMSHCSTILSVKPV